MENIYTHIIYIIAGIVTGYLFYKDGNTNLDIITILKLIMSATWVHFMLSLLFLVIFWNSWG